MFPALSIHSYLTSNIKTVPNPSEPPRKRHCSLASHSEAFQNELPCMDIIHRRPNVRSPYFFRFCVLDFIHEHLTPTDLFFGKL